MQNKTVFYRLPIIIPNIYSLLYSSEAVSASIPMPSLEFGSMCVRNAVLLLQNDKIEYMPSHTPYDLHKDYLFGCIQSAGAYIALCLGDPVVALKYSQELLKSEKINKVHKYVFLFRVIIVHFSVIIINVLGFYAICMRPKH